MKIVTSITIFNDAVGTRMSVSYSEVDDTTGQIISDNKRADRVVTDKASKDLMDNVKEYAQDFVDALE